MKLALEQPDLMGLFSTESLQALLVGLAVEAASGGGAGFLGEGRQAEEQHEGRHDDDEDEPFVS